MRNVVAEIAAVIYDSAIEQRNTNTRRNEMAYQIREKIAYSRVGKFIATIVRDRKFPNSRVHWVQQAFADWQIRGLK